MVIEELLEDPELVFADSFLTALFKGTPIRF
jgi:hypothetical protein